MSEAGSSSTRRNSSPRGVPPGSRTETTSVPRARSHSTRRRTCVLFPAPSGPSSTTSRPRAMPALSERDDRTRRAHVDAFEDPVVHATHDLVEVFLRDQQPLIRRAALDLSEQRIELFLHRFGRTLTALYHLLRVDAK